IVLTAKTKPDLNAYISTYEPKPAGLDEHTTLAQYAETDFFPNLTARLDGGEISYAYHANCTSTLRRFLLEPDTKRYGYLKHQQAVDALRRVPSEDHPDGGAPVLRSPEAAPPLDAQKLLKILLTSIFSQAEECMKFPDQRLLNGVKFGKVEERRSSSSIPRS
ncbi:MAG: hypothetical protein JWN27_1943, partial [Candidatus Eremiobacteraeota bacterium]|nr:hypothetical protein [Candidatus Eremiobacteraeota bacterium]